MGCDIHAYAEAKENGKWIAVAENIFDWRSYRLFGFLADVRNYSAITPISKVRGIPLDSPFYDSYCNDSDYHSGSWLSLDELLSYDYKQLVEDRRCTIQTDPNSWNGGATCEPGKGKKMSLEDFLGEAFFRELQKLKDLGIERIVFAFDN